MAASPCAFQDQPCNQCGPEPVNVTTRRADDNCASCSAHPARKPGERLPSAAHHMNGRRQPVNDGLLRHGRKHHLPRRIQTSFSPAHQRSHEPQAPVVGLLGSIAPLSPPPLPACRRAHGRRPTASTAKIRPSGNARYRPARAAFCVRQQVRIARRIRSRRLVIRYSAVAHRHDLLMTRVGINRQPRLRLVRACSTAFKLNDSSAHRAWTKALYD